MRAVIISMVSLLVVSSGVSAASGTTQPVPSSTGRFIVHCQPTVRGEIDPILVPGTRGVSHLHDFFGPENLPTATLGDLRRGRTSCSTAADRSAYWVPVLTLDGIPVDPSRAQAYYQVNALTQPFPSKFTMIVGAGSLPAGLTNSPEAPRPVTWICGGTGVDRSSRKAETCRKGEYLMASVEFPGCSNGAASSVDHRSHVAYADLGGRCPASHPRHIPQLTLFLQWSCNIACGPRTGWGLSGGDTGSFHADFASRWKNSELRSLISRCKSRDCGVVGELPSAKPRTFIKED